MPNWPTRPHPSALVYAHMFNPTVGHIVMALAVMACVGSLLGWQFTLAQTAKMTADQGMSPEIFQQGQYAGCPDYRHACLRRAADLDGAVDHFTQCQRAVRQIPSAWRQ